MHCFPGFAAAWPPGAFSSSCSYFQKFCSLLSKHHLLLHLVTQRLAECSAKNACNRYMWADFIFTQMRDICWPGRRWDRWFCFLVERKVIEAILKGQSRGLADALAPDFGPAGKILPEVFRNQRDVRSQQFPSEIAAGQLRPQQQLWEQGREGTFNSPPRN